MQIYYLGIFKEHYTMKNHQKCEDSRHPCHEKHLPRLNRVTGQIEGVKKMIKEQRYCPDILTQLHAARSAIRNLEIQILDSHLSQCVTDAFQSKDQVQQKQKIEEIRQLIKQFE
jgi:CsoR family transcriptional regulator, copper-sensing transcriptional repressor